MLYGIAYLLLLCYKTVQRVTLLNTVGNCNTVVSIILHHNIMGPPSYAVHRWPKRRYAAHGCTGTKHRCDLHVPFPETEINFKRDSAKLEWNCEISGYRHGIAVQEEFSLDCLKLEEAADMLFRNVSNQFPTDDA
jgi:hypothetical protein